MKYEELNQEQKEKFASMVVDGMDMDVLRNTALDRVLDNWEKDNDLFYEDDEIYEFDKD